ncbi:MAG: glycosyltransferase family 39 protein [Planctomycetaceae bacterium]
MPRHRETFPAFLQRTWWIWAVLLTLYGALAAALPPLDDEVYYWSWSPALQWSYYDHPPLTAWLIRLSTHFWGRSVLGIRFPACACITFTLAVIAYLTECVVNRHPSHAFRRFAVSPLIIGLVITPLFTLGGILITPDAPLLAAWAAYALWLVRIHEKLEFESASRSLWPWWLLGGVILGLGGLAKYTMIVAVPAGFVSFLLTRWSWRRWLPGYLAHGVISFAVASPILIFNLQHDFVPLKFQWEHASHDPASLKTFFEFVGIQIVLFGTLPWFLLPWCARYLRTLSTTPLLRVCASLYLVPLSFFLYKATRSQLEGNWALVAFVTVWPIAQAWYETIKQSRAWRRATAASFLIPAVCVLLLAGHILHPWAFIPPEKDRLTRQRARWRAVHDLAAVIQHLNSHEPTYTSTYQMTALLRFHGIDARQIEGASRPSHFTFPPQRVTDVNHAFVVAEQPLSTEFVKGFSHPQLIKSVPLMVRGRKIQTYELWEYRRDRDAGP